MLNKFVRLLGGDPNKREIEKNTQIVQEINSFESQFEALSDQDLRTKTKEFRARLAKGLSLDDILPEAFATVREASKRTLGLRHYDVQMIGGIVLHRGSISEMRTGEGKTLVATLPLYLNALALNPAWEHAAEMRWGPDQSDWDFVPIQNLPVGRSAHLITVNDYLARRDARWMTPIFNFLGLEVGVLQMAARTENGKKAFIVDLERSSPQEDQHQLRMVSRREAYLADIIYGTNSEFGFDYLRDNLAMNLSDRVQRGHFYAIVDEVDNVLIDEARTPLIISSPASDDIEWYVRMAQIVKQLRTDDYEVSEKDHTVSLTEIGEVHVEELLGIPLRDPERPEDVTPEQARLLGYLEQSLRAQFLFHRNKDYLVVGGKVIIVDEFTGRQMPGRRWSDGLHQAVEAKENVRVQAENVTSATITIQNYFRMYAKLAGMTGTALTEAEEFHKIYKLEVVAIPTNLDYQASRPESDYLMLEAKDEGGYKYQFYTHRTDPDKAPVLWKRKDYPDIVYRTEEAKLRAIMKEIMQYHVLGRPILVGTTSVELSEHVSNRLGTEYLGRLVQVIILRDAWFEKNKKSEEDGFQVGELQFLNEPLEKIQQAEMRRLGRELNITLNPLEPDNLTRLMRILRLDASQDPTLEERLKLMLKGGIQHQVLNARKHTEESQIIAGAGAFGAVTIATNMAGRGVDIKLGGEISEGMLSDVSRVLRRAGYEDPYDMSLEERRQALLKIDQVDYGIYEEVVQGFFTYLDDMERVKALGGLHVIGSERHEARRIDNQLRGRAARQGDPGSSRFFLSMQDELMRLFGGEQVDNMMQRLRIDDAMPLEHGLVSRLIEQSQTRVEGMHFDTRKHLLEYDDVLNTQRANIYSQRDHIFSKDDLSEDIIQMLNEEIQLRVPEALKDEEGPWRLLSWLEQIQPTLYITLPGGARSLLPSYTLKLILDGSMEGMLPKAKAQSVLEEVSRKSLEAEANHLVNSVKKMLESSREHLEEIIYERLDLLDTVLEGFENREEGSGTPNLRQMTDELTNSVRLPLRLTNDQQRILVREPRRLRNELAGQVNVLLTTQTLQRLVGAIGRRLEDISGINIESLITSDWHTITGKILDNIEQYYAQKITQYFNAGSGVISKEISDTLNIIPNDELEYWQVCSLMTQISQGTKTAFDRRTHRKVNQRTVRLSYIYYAAHLLESREPQAITEDVLEHLTRGRSAMQLTWGVSEIQRLGNATLADLNDMAQRGLAIAIGEENLAQIQTMPLRTLSREMSSRVIDELGRQALTESYRDLLLRVISWEWIEYLTQMEGLRVSISLEAYGQRDPLVQYKIKASEMWEELLTHIRRSVISNMFTSLRSLTGAQTNVEIPSFQPITSLVKKQAEDGGDESQVDKDGEDDSSLDEDVEAEDNIEEDDGLTKSAKRRRRKKR